MLIGNVDSIKRPTPNAHDANVMRGFAALERWTSGAWDGREHDKGT
jgi:hypothetical protein